MLEKICAALVPGGVYIFTTGGLDEPSEKSDTYNGIPDGLPLHYSVLGIPKFLELFQKYGCICRHLEYDQYPEMHLTLIAQKSDA